MKHATFKLTKRIILLILILSIALTGCAPTGEENVDPRDVLPDSWEYGYDNTFNELYFFYSGCKGIRYYDIDNVEIVLSFGGQFYDDLEPQREAHGFKGIDVFIGKPGWTETTKIHQIRISDEDPISEEYRILVHHNKNPIPEGVCDWATAEDVEYNHSEVVKIPKEIFTENIGVCGRIDIYVDTYLEEHGKSKCLTTTKFWYMKLPDDKIMLMSHDEYIEYYKPKKDN